MPDPGLRARVGAWVTSPGVQRFIIALIVVNAVTLGLETSSVVMADYGDLLHVADRAILTVFVAEIAAKLFAFGWRFFRDPWNVFDFLVVGIALVPASGPLAVLRTLRVLRVLRLVSTVPRLRMVIEALLHAIPGIGAIAGLLLLIFYVGAVMATSLFAADFPDWFGHIGRSMFTLFQIMTLESWSMGIVRPVMEQHPLAWLFFVPFIIVTSFAVLNLFIALIVNSMQSMQSETNDHVRAEALAAHDEREALSRQIDALTAEMRQIREALRKD